MPNSDKILLYKFSWSILQKKKEKKKSSLDQEIKLGVEFNQTTKLGQGNDLMVFPYDKVCFEFDAMIQHKEKNV